MTTGTKRRPRRKRIAKGVYGLSAAVKVGSRGEEHQRELDEVVTTDQSHVLECFAADAGYLIGRAVGWLGLVAFGVLGLSRITSV